MSHPERMAHPYWPLFDLVIRTPRVELRLPTPDELVALARLAADGIHNPEDMPFGFPWSDRPSPELERGVLQWNWRNLGTWTPEKWVYCPVVLVDGVVAGTQDIHAEKFAATRTVATGSWLGRRFQGKGIGKEMRSAVLHLAFAGLGADRAESAAFTDNMSSIGVSRAVGYIENGDMVLMRRDVADRATRFVMTRERWDEVRRDDITIVGLDACLELFGAA
jgi:RimJ/RimL family protein N-acetyltransferase